MNSSVIGTHPNEIGQDGTRLTIRRPDDWHVHLRDGAMLAAVANFTARQFARAIIMPNLVQPITCLVHYILLLIQRFPLIFGAR